jgi:CBS domain-containing protein
MGIRTVGQALGRSVFIEGASTLQQASALMLEANTEVAIVLAQPGHAALLTAEDVARALAEGHDTARTSVIVVADPKPLLTRADELLVNAHERMRDEQRDLAIAVDADGRPLGLVEL